MNQTGRGLPVSENSFHKRRMLQQAFRHPRDGVSGPVRLWFREG
jgi:hypothetical protein